MADGEEVFVGYLERMARDYPDKSVELVRVLAEGDYVAPHCHQQWPGSDDYADIDISRLDERGRIVEHWDMLQVILETSASDNGMFWLRCGHRSVGPVLLCFPCLMLKWA